MATDEVVRAARITPPDALARFGKLFERNYLGGGVLLLEGGNHRLGTTLLFSAPLHPQPTEVVDLDDVEVGRWVGRLFAGVDAIRTATK